MQNRLHLSFIQPIMQFYKEANGKTLMAKSPSSLASPVNYGIPEELFLDIMRSFNRMAGPGQIPGDCNASDYHSDMIRTLLRQIRLHPGRVSGILSVKTGVCNMYGIIHGGFIASVAEFVSIACARTVVAEDSDLLLGEFSVSYLSGAPQNANLVVDASILRSGRNLSIVVVEFKLQETGKLFYTTRSTFYNNMPNAKL